MCEKFVLILVFIISLGSLACQTASAPSAEQKNAPAANNLKELPPGFSTNAVPPSGNSTPGISANPHELPKGTTPTPGIPANPGKPLAKGATPTPGIPDPETIKKQRDHPVDINTVNNPPPGNSGGDLRPRKVGNSQ